MLILLKVFKMFFEGKGRFGKYSNKPSRAGGGGLGEGERIYLYLYDLYLSLLYAWSSALKSSISSAHLHASGHKAQADMVLIVL